MQSDFMRDYKRIGKINKKKDLPNNSLKTKRNKITDMFQSVRKGYFMKGLIMPNITIKFNNERKIVKYI
ncbi:hypothetical protein BpHYR1_013444 [Brachionus plicatilis]|uniref:Uncharacterized protein n=1 Tax=Brachionus plicatilis TaxID=10195 RepID=A0A3M7SFB4_BRAPC|nr:hypothetical protein BpHYR1_013444 [Brachionus plicatilis]